MKIRVGNSVITITEDPYLIKDISKFLGTGIKKKSRKSRKTTSLNKNKSKKSRKTSKPKTKKHK